MGEVDRMTLTSSVSQADVEVTVFWTKSKPASVVDMVRLGDGEKDFLTGRIGDVGGIRWW